MPLGGGDLNAHPEEQRAKQAEEGVGSGASEPNALITYLPGVLSVTQHQEKVAWPGPQE